MVSNSPKTRRGTFDTHFESKSLSKFNDESCTGKCTRFQTNEFCLNQQEMLSQNHHISRTISRYIKPVHNRAQVYAKSVFFKRVTQ